MRGVVFLIHGMFATAEFWQGYRDFFEQKGYVVRAPNLLGHSKGQDAVELKDIRINDYVQQCVREIEDIAEKPVIMGHSMGALIAQKLAELGLAKKLVLVSAAPPKGISVLSRSALRTFMGSVPHIALGQPFKLPLSGVRYGIMNTLPAQEQERGYAALVYESANAAREFVRGTVAVNTDRISCPVLVVAGSEDRTIVPGISRRVAERYNASYIEYSGYCHWRLIQGTGWEKVAEGISSWIENS
jgi:non-heme chloroperoxidase